MSLHPQHAALAKAMIARESELIALHRALVQVPSVNRGDGSSARETEVAQVAAAYLREGGIESEIVESSPGRGNLMARVSGAGTGRTLLMISHSDVVPPGDESAWTFPPFSGENAEGRIWGRGSSDCKMLVASELFALRLLKESNLSIRGELRIAIGADEEAGGRWGFGWMAGRHADFLRADLALNEGGGSFLGKAPGGEALFSVGCGEKGRYEVIFRSTGPGAHASTPWGRVNPLIRLAQLGEAIMRLNPEPTGHAPVFGALSAALQQSGLDADAIIELARKKFSEAMGRSLMAQSRMTLVPTIFTAGEKSNAIPDRAELRCDARLLPGQSRDLLDTTIASLLAAHEGIQCTIEETARASVSEFDADVAGLFTRALARTFDGVTPRAIPTWCTGFTDSRFIREVGTPAYGFQVIEPLADPNRLSIHCIDESIETRMLLPCARALGHFALEFFAASPAS